MRHVVALCAVVGSIVGCPSPETSPPATDAGGLDGIASGVDAAVLAETDAFVPPGVDAPLSMSGDAATLDSAIVDAGAGGWRATPACLDNSDCDDGLACTDDLCRLDFASSCPPGVRCSICQHTPRTALCGPAETCDDRRGCVAAMPCSRDADCADDDPCTMSERCDPSSRVCVRRVLDGDLDGEAPPICGGSDCNDAAPDVRPGGPEYCNRADNDCDARVDEGAGEICGAGFACTPDRFCECIDAAATSCGTLGLGPMECVYTDSDDEHCGDCYTRCDVGSRCVSGRCACDDPLLTACSGRCIDTTSDALHCGSCTRRCSSGQVCAASTCRSCGGDGEPCCAGSVCDAATLSCDGSTCAVRECALPYDPLPAAYVPRCARATLTCVQGCSTGACRGGCLDADATPEYMGINCNRCVNNQLLACLDDAGCGDEWAAYSCCYEDNCAGLPSCTPCASRLTAWQTCAGRVPCYVDAGLALQCFAPS